jgi:hypothetical protein
MFSVVAVWAPSRGILLSGSCKQWLDITDIAVLYASQMIHTSLREQQYIFEPTAVMGGPRATGCKVLKCLVTALSCSPKEVTVTYQR